MLHCTEQYGKMTAPTGGRIADSRPVVAREIGPHFTRNGHELSQLLTTVAVQPEDKSADGRVLVIGIISCDDGTGNRSHQLLFHDWLFEH